MPPSTLDHASPGVRHLQLASLAAERYGLLMSVPLLTIGAFSSLVALLAGLVHLVMGLAFLAARRAFERQRPAGLWTIRFLATLLTLPLPAFGFEMTRKADLRAIDGIFPAIVTAYGLALLVLSARKDVRHWTA